MIQALERSIGEARRNALVFSVLTVLLTPFLMAGAAVGLVFALGFSHHRHHSMSLDLYHGPLSFLTSLDALIALVVAVSLCDRRGGKSPRPLEALAAVAGVVGLFVFSQSDRPHDASFWIVYAVLATATLGLAGRAYVPDDGYYLGLCSGLSLNHSSLQHQRDHAHWAAGFAVLIPGILADAYGSIFGSLWLLRPTTRKELAVATGLFQAVAAEDAELLRERQGAAGRRAVPALRLLHQLDLVQPGRARLHLTGRGRDLVRSML